jgi:putative hydrolase of the HAD superfamily
VPPQEVVYIEDRDMFVEVAATIGIRGIVHKGVDSTRAALAELGLFDRPAAFVA